jgi:hypothetical protein
MRLSGEPCPICNRPMTPLDSVRNLTFHERPERAHNRCWYENQDLIDLLARQEPPEITLRLAVEKARQG